MRPAEMKGDPRRNQLVPSLAALALVALMAGACSLLPASGPVLVQVDATRKYQTWRGWEATVNNYHRSDNPLLDQDRHPVDQAVLDAMLDDAVGNLGITAIDLPVSLGDERHSIEPVNDNDDPFDLDDSRIRWNWVDAYVRAIVLPMKRRVEERGDAFTFSVRAVAWDSWQWDEPAADPGQEYAEIMFGLLERLRNRFEITPEFFSVQNEPDNDAGTESKEEIVRGAAHLAARMTAAGYPTKLNVPEVSFVANTLPWLDAFVGRPELVPMLGRISFHGYSAGFSGQAGLLHRIRSRARLREIRARARQLGLDTAQTEWWFTTDHAADIITTMTEADVVSYQPFVLSGWKNVPDRSSYAITFSDGEFPMHRATGFRRGVKWNELRQFMNFIRPGDVRIAAVSDDAAIRPVAFTKPDGRYVLVFLNESEEARTVRIEGLSSGPYAVITSTPEGPGDVEQAITTDGETPLIVEIVANGLITIYGRGAG